MLYDLTEMRRRLAALDAEREPLVMLIAAAEQHEGVVGKVIKEGGNVTIRTMPARRSGADTVRAQTEALALEMIDQRGKPVPTRDVVDVMEERGMPLPDKNVINVVSARLSNSDRLKGRRDLGWWPAERPWPDKGSSGGSLPLQQENGGADVRLSGSS